MRALFLFGPNLGALGRRDADLYGGRGLEAVMAEVVEAGRSRGHEVGWRQSDHEGALIGWILGAADEGFEAIVLNPGALTHYSYAIRDAVEASDLPTLEVHFSNVHAREGFRRRSVVSEVAAGTIAGFGPGSYHVALEALAWITDRGETD